MPLVKMCFDVFNFTTGYGKLKEEEEDALKNIWRPRISRSYNGGNKDVIAAERTVQWWNLMAWCREFWYVWTHLSDEIKYIWVRKFYFFEDVEIPESNE